MEYLTDDRARDAVKRAFVEAFIIPQAGNRVNETTIDWDLIRRNDYEPLAYRTRLSEGGVLLGHFIGDAIAAKTEPVLAEAPAV